jgi:hypothetical protein
VRVECYCVSLAPLKEAAEELMKRLRTALGASLRRKVGGPKLRLRLVHH